MPNVRDFGALGDGVHDDAPAFAAAIKAFPEFAVTGLEDLTVNRFRAGVLDVPPGVYRLSTPLVLNRNIHLRGAGGAWGVGLSTVLCFDSGSHGILVTKTGTGVVSDPFCNGVGSLISNLQVTAAGQSTFANGISLMMTATVRDCLVMGFKGHGIYVQSECTPGPSAWSDAAPMFTLDDGTFGGTNGYHIENTITQSNGGDGFHVVGGDSNSGILINVTSDANGGWAFFDQAQISTLYLNPLAELNANGAVCIIYDIHHAVFIGGNLTEGNGPVDHIGYNTLFVGCRVAHPDKQDSWLIANGGSINAPSFTAIAVDGVVVSTLCPVDTTQTALMMQARGDAMTNYRLRHDDSRFCWQWQSVGGIPVAEFLTNAHPTRPNLFRAPNGFLLGNAASGGDGIFLTAMPAVPAAGTWAAGDVVKNSAPNVGQPKGWVCTVAGTPGTWFSEGAL